ncbi:MAG: DUF1574 family protein [bacterium]
MYKKFFIRLSLLVIPLVILILFVNIKVDSGFVIHNRSTEIAKILVSGSNAGIKYVPSKWGGLQIAIVKERLKSDKNPKKDIIVFGTSRSSEINSEIFPENTFFNCAMPGGNVLDYIALYGLYKRNKILPKYLIISIDPWSFHARKSVTIDKKIQFISDTTIPLEVNKDLVKDYQYALKSLNIKTNANFVTTGNKLSFDNIIELFNPNYFQINIKSIFDKMVIKTNQSSIESYFVLRSDGGYSLTPQSQIDSLNVKDEAFKFIKIRNLDLFIKFDTTSNYWLYFRKLLAKMKADGVTPIVYISPINPIVYSNLAKSSKVDLEKQIEKFCKANGILIVGSFNPNKYGYRRVSNFFMDAYHPVNSVVKDVFYQHATDLKAIGLNVSNKAAKLKK